MARRSPDVHIVRFVRGCVFLGSSGVSYPARSLWRLRWARVVVTGDRSVIVAARDEDRDGEAGGGPTGGSPADVGVRPTQTRNPLDLSGGCVGRGVVVNGTAPLPSRLAVDSHRKAACSHARFCVERIVQS